MIDIWRRFYRGLRDDIWNDLNTKVKASLILAFITGVSIVSYWIHEALSAKGCSMAAENSDYLIIGVGSLTLSCMAIMCCYFGYYIILSIPKVLQAIGEYIKYRGTGGVSAIAWGNIFKWVGFFTSFFVLLMANAFAIGYIAWVVIC